MDQPENIPEDQSAESADFRRRTGAFFIDSAIHSAVLSLVVWYSNLVPFVWSLAVASFLILVCYYPYFWIASGQTPGSRILGVMVVRTNGSALNFGDAVARYAGCLLSVWPLFLGFIWATFDRKSQGWHDKVADTRVVRVGATSRGPISIALSAAVILIIAFLTTMIGFQNFRVEGSSMLPAYEGGEYVLVNTLVYKVASPSQGDVIVFELPRDRRSELAKRVIAVPGDVVEMRNGTVVVSGESLAETYLAAKGNSNMGPLQLGDKEYFVLGDNRRSSNDSRSWGPVHEDDIIGRMWSTYWPP